LATEKSASQDPTAILIYPLPDQPERPPDTPEAEETDEEKVWISVNKDIIVDFVLIVFQDKAEDAPEPTLDERVGNVEKKLESMEGLLNELLTLTKALASKET
jgi:hypothetical protein